MKENIFKKVVDKAYWTGLTISLLGIAHEMSLQELVREQQAKGLQLGTVAHFLNDHFVGDIGDAFALIFVIPTILEVANHEIQKSETAARFTKKASEFVTHIAPYVMAGLFFAAALDAETSQTIVKIGTPDFPDLTGALFGAAFAFPSILKFRNKVYPKAANDK